MKPHGIKQSGLSLIELMIAAALGLMMLASLGYVMVGSHSTYRTQSGSARVQDSGRTAMEFIGRNIRLAGRLELTPSASDNRDDLDAGTVPITGTNGNGTASDTLTVQYQVSNMHGADIVDCNGDNGRASDLRGTQNAIQGIPGGEYGTVQNAIDISNSELRCTGNGGGGAQPVAEGIEDMQLVYGIDSDDDDAVNNWVDASAVTNWSQVIAVQVCLMARSVDTGVVSGGQTLINCQGTAQAFNDNRLRRVVTSVFTVRSRVNGEP